MKKLALAVAATFVFLLPVSTDPGVHVDNSSHHNIDWD